MNYRNSILSLAFLCLALSFGACKEKVEPVYPTKAVVPDESVPWTFECSDLTQFPCPSTEFTDVCPVFSPDGSTAYFMSNGKNIIAVEVASGKIKWQTNDIGEMSYPTATAATQPAVNPVTGEIYINAHISKNETNMFFALDPATGHISKKLDGIGIYASNLNGPAVTADGKYIFIGTNGATLRMIDAETFKIIGRTVSRSGFRYALAEGKRCVMVGNRNEIFLCWANPDAEPSPEANLFHSEYILGDDYYATPNGFPCFSKDGLKVWMPTADADVFGGAVPSKAFVTCIDLKEWKTRNYTVEGAKYVWSIISDEEGSLYVTASASSGSAGAFVRKYSSDMSSEIWTWTVPQCFLDWPNGLRHAMPAIGDDGNLYIVSRENNDVYRLETATGEAAKVLENPVAAYPNKAQSAINICGGKLVTDYGGLRSGVIAGADFGVDAPKAWSCVVGDPCGTKCYEKVWGLSDQLSDSDIPVGSQNVYGFDAKSNSALRSDMLNFLDKAIAEVEGTVLATEFANLKSNVKAKMNSEPFAWLDQVNKFVTETIAGYPPRLYDAPGKPEGDELARRLLLMLRDYPLHEVTLASDEAPMESGQAEAFNASMSSMQEAVVAKLLNWLDTPAPSKGVLELFKIYNMGYVARTANHCVGIDIYWWGTDDQMRSLCDHIDAIFVSHAHGDHYCLPLLAEMSAREGKSLFMTSGMKSSFTPQGVGTLYALDENQIDPIDCNGISVQAAIGAQGEVACQLFSIEMDGFCIWANGDNGVTSAFNVARDNFPAPYLTMISLAGSSKLMTAAAHAAKGAATHDVGYIVSHENEVHHTIDGRVSYKHFFEYPTNMGNSDYARTIGKYAAMDYGEILTLSNK